MMKISNKEIEASRWHLQAAMTMVTSRGGVPLPGDNGFFGNMVTWILKDPVHANGALLSPACLTLVFDQAKETKLV